MKGIQAGVGVMAVGVAGDVAMAGEEVLALAGEVVLEEEDD